MAVERVCDGHRANGFQDAVYDTIPMYCPTYWLMSKTASFYGYAFMLYGVCTIDAQITLEKFREKTCLCRPSFN